MSNITTLDVTTDPLDRVPADASIACLASGGVDSSVAIHILCAKGFKPDLFYIKIGMEDEEGVMHCSAEEDIEMVQVIARKYGLKFDVVDLHQAYWDRVVSYTIDSVRRGLTPNPDMMCNKLIKFGVFNDEVGKDYDYIATGHYATTYQINGKTYLGTSPDPVKDQTDFLAQINLSQVSKLIFPIGRLHKSEVREVAQSARLINANRKDSQGICFLGKINYNTFIERYLGVKDGRIIEYETGKVLGRHKGFWFHTIGQRKGLGLSGGPWFVVKKNIKKNIVFVSQGYDPEKQYGQTIQMDQFDFITDDLFTPDGQALLGLHSVETQNPIEVSFKIRHTPDFANARFFKNDDGSYTIESDELIQGIAPGQYATVYSRDGRICFGSGQIVMGL